MTAVKRGSYKEYEREFPEAALTHEVKYQGPPECATCGKRHDPLALHAAGCQACMREKAKGLKRRDAVLCFHKCQYKPECRNRVHMNSRGYILSNFCKDCDADFEARMREPKPGAALTVLTEKQEKAMRDHREEMAAARDAKRLGPLA